MWRTDPVKALEGLSETEQTSQLPSRAPVLGKPTLRAHLGLVPEESIGPYGSPQRRQAEEDLLRAFLQQQQGHVMACAPVTAKGEGTRSFQMEYLFHSTPEATEARQHLRDLGGATLTLPTRPQPVLVPCLDGPGRLPSSLVRIVVSGLPPDFMIPGGVRVLLESAGYTTGGAEGVIVRAEHGGEQKADIAAFAPEVMKLGVVVGVVRPPASDPTLSQLPRQFSDVGGTVTIRVTGSRPQQPAAASAPQPFVRSNEAPQQQHSAPRQALLRPLDAVTDLDGRLHGDRRGLGIMQPVMPPPRPPPYPPGFGPGSMAPRGLPMPPFHFWRAPLPPPPRGPPPAHALAPVEMEIDPLVLPQTAVLATSQLGQQNPPAQNEPQDAVPMETEQPVAALPDVPLVDSAMRWLEDEEDPSRSQEARREHLRQLHSRYPAVWQGYAADSSYPPAPEVRSSLRELGGLPTDQASEERPSSPSPAPAVSLHRHSVSQPSPGPGRPGPAVHSPAGNISQQAPGPSRQRHDSVQQGPATQQAGQRSRQAPGPGRRGPLEIQQSPDLNQQGPATQQAGQRSRQAPGPGRQGPLEDQQAPGPSRQGQPAILASQQSQPTRRQSRSAGKGTASSSQPPPSSGRVLRPRHPPGSQPALPWHDPALLRNPAHRSTTPQPPPPVPTRRRGA